MDPQIEKMLNDIDILTGVLRQQEESEPITLNFHNKYTVQTMSGSTYTYDAKTGTITVSSKSVGDFTRRGHFIGLDDFDGIKPGVIATGYRVALLYENEDGNARFISTSGATNIETEGLTN